MKFRSWLIAGGCAVLLIAGLAAAFRPRPLEVETATVTRGPFESVIEEDGKTRLRDRYVLSAPLTGVLERITLREGDLVEAGTVIASLRPTLPPMLDDRTLREQQARVDVALAQAKRADARVEAARVALQQARSEAQRSERLANQGFLSPSKLETDRLQTEAAQKELDAAVEERHVAAHTVEQARAAVTAVRSGATSPRSFAVRAPIRGRVLRVVQSSETTVALGIPLIELGDTSRLEVVAELLTTDAVRAPPGAPVVIDRWGGPHDLRGVVRTVEPGAFTKVSVLGVEEQRVRVVIDLTSEARAWQLLGDGFRVGVRIVTLSMNDVLRVPVSAVFPLPAPEGEPASRFAVFVLDGDVARQMPVRVGARSGHLAWLEEGPAPGSRVVVYPPAALRDGAAVRPRSVAPAPASVPDAAPAPAAGGTGG